MQHQIPLAALIPGGEAMARAVSSCVHCGFCLPACPTYAVLGEEMDSPRGRIVLMKEVLEGTLALDDAAPHLDRCLGCLACETACPSGVRYRDLIEPFRERLVAQRSPGAQLRLRALLRVMESPSRFRLAARAGSAARLVALLLPASLRTMLRLLPPTLPAQTAAPAFMPAVGPRRGRVALMTGCVQSVLRPSITAAALRVLAANGVDTVVPGNQGCCGALAGHVGDAARGRALGDAHRRHFPTDVDAVLATAAGCGSAMKDRHHDGPPVLDLLEYLDGLGLSGLPRLDAPTRVAYQDACHLAHAQQVTSAPRRLLQAVAQLTLVPVTDSGLCCGSAGLYNLEQPALAAQLGARKAAALVDSGAAVVATANIGCLMQMQTSLAAATRALPVLHVVELLDLAYRVQTGPQ
ncbi:MAG: heterodisulfide reductase-related iron-sulfur binding cluster [Acidobacteriota bacterium]